MHESQSVGVSLVDAECKWAFLLLDDLLMLVVAIILLFDPQASAVLETESELSNVSGAILVNLATIALGQSVNKPALVNVAVAAVLAVLVLQDPAEAMEVLGVDEHLTLIDVIVVFPDADQLQLESIWLMDLWRSVSVLHVVVWVNAAVALDP